MLRRATHGEASAASPVAIDAPPSCTLASLRSLLGRGDAIRVRGVPDARAIEAVRAAELVASSDAPATPKNVGELRARASAALAGAIDPASTFDLDPDYETTPVPSDRAGAFDLLARRRDRAQLHVDAFTPPENARPWSAFTNVPARGVQGAIGAELRAHLRARLPDYMVPTAFVALDAFPLTPNGKVDRKALPVPDRARREAGDAYVAPTSDVERIIATMWQDMLAIERVGVDQNFFDLGANSLMMVQASGRLKASLGRDVSLVDMFRFRTVRALAAHLGDGGAAPSDANAAEGTERAQARKDAMARRRELRTSQRRT